MTVLRQVDSWLRQWVHLVLLTVELVEVLVVVVVEVEWVEWVVVKVVVVLVAVVLDLETEMQRVNQMVNWEQNGADQGGC